MRRALSSCLLVAVAAFAQPLRAQNDQASPWCAPELETLAHDVCFHTEEPAHGGRRTLVVFLHGLVQEGADWQHNQQRGMVRGARRNHFSLIAPRGRAGLNKSGGGAMVAWPTSRAAQEQHEAALLAEWLEAQRAIEQRSGKPFDEVFVVGFSNGAYYAASLALRGRFGADGFAVFAGGAGYGAPAAVAKEQRAPVFVGVAGKDKTAADSRALRRTLKKHGWPHRAETRPVGHAIADAHLDHALAYLRTQKDERAPKRVAAPVKPAP
jgi:predicted esterase